MAKQFVLGEKYTTGYNTFETFGLNLITNVENRTEICIFYYDKKADSFIYQFGYNVGQPDQDPPDHKLHRDNPNMSLARAGERDLNLNYGRIDYAHGGSSLSAMIVKTDPFNIFIRMETSSAADSEGYYLLVFKGREGYPARITRSIASNLFTFESYEGAGGALHVYNADGSTGNFSVLESRMKLESIFRENMLHLYEDIFEGDVFCVVPRGLTYFALSSELEMDNITRIEDLDRIFHKAGKRFADSEPSFSTNYFQDIGAAMKAPILWNLSYNERNQKAFLPVSKSWVAMMEEMYSVPQARRGGPLIFNWDTALAAIAVTPFNAELAADILTGLISEMTDNGRLPQMVLDDFVSDRTSPPVVFIAVWGAYLALRDKEFLSFCYHKLRKHYMFLKTKRAGSVPGLLAWGADVAGQGAAEKRNYIPGRVGAIYESGLDDSPMWDECGFDPASMTLDCDCVDLTSLFGAAASVMALAAAELKLPDDASMFAADLAACAGAVEKNLFDSSAGLFANRSRDGKFSSVRTPTSFYPLLFMDLSPEIKKRVNASLKDPASFGTIFKMMSVEASNKNILADGDYWRGRIWPPLNYLTYRGLRNQGMFRRSYELALSSVRQFQFEWQKQAHVHENYSAYTGFGEPQPGTYCRTSPFYTWGSLMGLMFLEEFFEVQPDGKFRFGSLYSLDEVRLGSIRVGKNRIDLRAGAGRLEFFIDGERKIMATPSAMIFDYCENESKINFKAYGRGNTCFKISKLGDTLSAYVRVDGKILCYASVVRSSPITFEVDFGPLTENEATGEITQKPVSIEIEKIYVSTREQ